MSRCRILSHELCSILFATLKSPRHQLNYSQKRAMKIIFYELSYDEALNIAGISTLENIREYLSNNLFNDIVLNDDHKLAKLLPSKAGNRELRKESLLKFHQQVQIVSETLLSTFMLRNITNQMFLEHFRIFNSYRYSTFKYMIYSIY